MPVFRRTRALKLPSEYVSFNEPSFVGIGSFSFSGTEFPLMEGSTWKFLEGMPITFEPSQEHHGEKPLAFELRVFSHRSYTLNFCRYSGRNSLPIPGLSGARTALFAMRSRSNVDPDPLKLPDSI
jgi:hypothetical protein